MRFDASSFRKKQKGTEQVSGCLELRAGEEEWVGGRGHLGRANYFVRYHNETHSLHWSQKVHQEGMNPGVSMGFG